MTKFEVGDQVRQVAEGPYRARVPGLVGTVVEIQSDTEVYAGIDVNFPDIDTGVWPFRPSELELVSIVVEESE